jgi:hypothetical protein
MDPDVPHYFYAINAVAQAALLLTLAVGLALAVQRTALTAPQKSATWIAIMATLVIWFGLAQWLAKDGFFLAPRSSVPPIAFAIVIPIVTGLFILLSTPRFKAVVEAVPQSWMTGLQVYRALGAMFLALWLQGRMPGEFALPAGTGDVIVGVTAPIVAWLNATRSPAAPAATLVWNVFGIADLVVAVGTGFLTSPSPYQMLAFDRPNELIAQHPFVLVPIFFVPLSIILHGLSLWKLRRAAEVRPAFA